MSLSSSAAHAGTAKIVAISAGTAKTGELVGLESGAALCYLSERAVPCLLTTEARGELRRAPLAAATQASQAEQGAAWCGSKTLLPVAEGYCINRLKYILL